MKTILILLAVCSLLAVLLISSYAISGAIVQFLDLMAGITNPEDDHVYNKDFP